MYKYLAILVNKWGFLMNRKINKRIKVYTFKRL